MRKRTMLAALGALVSVLIYAAPAAAHPRPGPVTVSGPTPYASCSTPSHDGDSVRLNVESSPVVSANPRRRGNLVAVYEQDEWSSKGGHGAVAAYTFDGGRTWRRTTLPFTTCAPGGGGLYGHVAVPRVSFGADGTAYAMGMSYEGVGVYPRSVVATESTDGGRSWRAPEVLASYPRGGFRDDLTADPVRHGVAYASWQIAAPDAAGVQHTIGYFARTVDHGRTWSTPLAIAGTGDRAAYNNQIVVDRRTGRLYDTYDSCGATSCDVAFRTSADHGRTWSEERTIAHQHEAAHAALQPGTGIPIDTITTPESAISASGMLVVAFEDSRFSAEQYSEIAVSISRDHGRTWTEPKRVNTPTGHPAFLPSVAVTRRGTIGVTYYDVRRDDPTNAPFSTDVWGTTSTDGVHFRRAQHLAGSFDVLGSPGDLQDLRLGAAESLVAVGHHFVAVFQQSTCASAPCNPDNPDDIYAARFSARAR